MYSKYIKRLLDFVISFVALIILFPLLLILIVLLYFANEGAGVFFTQRRPGKDEKIFKIIKFKTMNDKKGEDGKLLPDAERLTKVGKFVRKTSIDELPQLINVLKGDMSLIGPRPLLVQYLPLYNKEQHHRHDVRPGITGWAQVNGRNLLKLSKKFDYDVWYVDNFSLKLDLRIILLTVTKVLKKQDIGDGNATMEFVDDLHFKDRIKNK